MVPMAFIGPATSGFTTASLIQSGVTTTANFVVKEKTGKTISEHAFEKIGKKISLDSGVLIQSYLPHEKNAAGLKVSK
tara:strand:+ start:567 stop:800 length:234 start_codon:yes stop_codon:yes gene_type:complete